MNRRFPLCALLCALSLFLPSCGASPGLDLANAQQYQAEIHAVALSATQVRQHMAADLARGKTKEQIALDCGWATFWEAMGFLAGGGAPASAPAAQR